MGTSQPHDNLGRSVIMDSHHPCKLHFIYINTRPNISPHYQCGKLIDVTSILGTFHANSTIGALDLSGHGHFSDGKILAVFGIP